MALPRLTLRSPKVSHTFFLKVTYFRILLILKIQACEVFPIQFLRISEFRKYMWFSTLNEIEVLTKICESRNED